MRENLVGALWRLAVYAVVCSIGAFALIAVFAQLRFQSEKTYTAQFANVSGLEGGNFVRIAGVEVGKVKSISIQPDTTVLVKFTAADSAVLTEGTRAAIRFADLIGGRYVSLEEGAGGVSWVWCDQKNGRSVLEWSSGLASARLSFRIPGTSQPV